jgi:hypothetical protein
MREYPEIFNIARCAEHGLHGCRTRCFECGEEAEQVPMVDVREVRAELARLRAVEAAARDLVDDDEVELLGVSGRNYRVPYASLEALRSVLSEPAPEREET